jgi:hypothetical protein
MARVNPSRADGYILSEDGTLLLTGIDQTTSTYPHETVSELFTGRSRVLDIFLSLPRGDRSALAGSISGPSQPVPPFSESAPTERLGAINRLTFLAQSCDGQVIRASLGGPELSWPTLTGHRVIAAVRVSSSDPKTNRKAEYRIRAMNGQIAGYEVKEDGVDCAEAQDAGREWKLWKVQVRWGHKPKLSLLRTIRKPKGRWNPPMASPDGAIVGLTSPDAPSRFLIRGAWVTLTDSRPPDPAGSRLLIWQDRVIVPHNNLGEIDELTPKRLKPVLKGWVWKAQSTNGRFVLLRNHQTGEFQLLSFKPWQSR